MRTAQIGPDLRLIFLKGHYQQAYLKLNPQRLADNVVRRHISIFHTFSLQKCHLCCKCQVSGGLFSLFYFADCLFARL